MRKAFGFLFIVGILSFQMITSAVAGEMPYRTTFLGWAAEGYDVVAYFRESKPVEGNSDFSHEWSGVKWRFSSAENRDLFAASPEKYAPQYGGYCAYAVSQGYTASVVPEAWSIVDDKLYLNYSKGVRSIWEKDIPGYIGAADKNWPGISASL